MNDQSEPQDSPDLPDTQEDDDVEYLLSQRTDDAMSDLNHNRNPQGGVQHAPWPSTSQSADTTMFSSDDDDDLYDEIFREMELGQEEQRANASVVLSANFSPAGGDMCRATGGALQPPSSFMSGQPDEASPVRYAGHGYHHLADAARCTSTGARHGDVDARCTEHGHGPADGPADGSRDEEMDVSCG